MSHDEELSGSTGAGDTIDGADQGKCTVARICSLPFSKSTPRVMFSVVVLHVDNEQLDLRGLMSDV